MIRMKNIVLPLCLLLLFRPALLSQRVVEVSYIQDTHGNYVFSCTNKAWCNYVLRVEFTSLKNARSDHTLPFVAEVKPGASKLFVLSPENKSDAIQIGYKSSYRKGCLQAAPDPGFVYLLPVAPGKETQAYIVGDTSGTGKEYAVRLKMKPGDTIWSARRGVVTEVSVGSDENDAGATATKGWNYIEIVHGDCSFGQYGVFKKDGAFVKPGQTVEAGTPLGLVGGDKFGRGSEARFSVGYFQDAAFLPILLQFWSKKKGKGILKHGGFYTSEYPQAIVTQEMKKPPAKNSPAKKPKGKTQ
jgi:hypothetical protein